MNEKVRTSCFLVFSFLLFFFSTSLSSCDGGDKDDDITPPDGGEEVVKPMQGSFADNQSKEQVIALETEGKSIQRTLTFTLTDKAAKAVQIKFSADYELVKTYNSKNKTELIAFPENTVVLSNAGGATLAKGSRSASVNITLDAKKIENGEYLLPIVAKCTTSDVKLDIVTEVVYYRVKVDRPPLPGVVSICYIEVNDANPLNAGSYTLADSGRPIFDIAILFAANINYDAAKGLPTLHFNENVTHILNNKNKYIKPLQDKGIKVTLSVLGNWAGIGFSNMTDVQITHFVQLCKDAVSQYGLDGLDFDDEYADYGKDGLPTKNRTSYAKMLVEMRKAMPGKLLTLYYCSTGKGTGNDFGSLHGMKDEVNGQKVGEMIDYSYWPFYSDYFSILNESTCIAGLTKKQWGPAPINIDANSPNANVAKGNAQKMVDEGFGVNLVYNLRANDYSSYLTGLSQIFYREATVRSGQAYRKDW